MRGDVRGLDILRGALERAVSVLGSQQPVVVIRPGDEPAFWLRVTTGTDAREVELGVLDTAALMLGDRVGVVEASTETMR